MSFNGRALLLTACLCVASTCGLSQVPTYPTNEDLRHAGRVNEARISPDGGSVLVNIAEGSAAGGRTHLWLVDVARNEYRQLTYSPEADKAGEHHGRWLDKDPILFLAK